MIIASRHSFSIMNTPRACIILFQNELSISSRTRHCIIFEKGSLYIHQLPTCLNVLKRSDLEASPSMLSVTTVLASDLELPGLPTTNNGILSSIHTTIMNTFSLKAVLRAMLSPSFSSFSTAFWQLGEQKCTKNCNKPRLQLTNNQV